MTYYGDKFNDQSADSLYK